MKREQNISLPVVGVASVVVIFAVLCMTVFALLTVASVQSELRLAERSQQAIREYYHADCAAQEILAQLRAGQHPEGVSQEGDMLTYSYPISGNQSLLVQVQVQGKSYRVLRWQAVSTTQWQPDTDLPVWEGTLPNKEDE